LYLKRVSSLKTIGTTPRKASESIQIMIIAERKDQLQEIDQDSGVKNKFPCYMISRRRFRLEVESYLMNPSIPYSGVTPHRS
jgi:protoheme ferro-lyase